MSTEATNTMALNPGWLDNTTAPVSSSNVAEYCYQYPTITGNYWYYTPTKIRLTLTEVQRLRAAAKKDAALKETLRKFTPHIEIEVDFP